ncbi:MAG: glycoside hydrolase family 3 C-terminal domain-containing protein [Steroidobacteraceae bacterium]
MKRFISLVLALTALSALPLGAQAPPNPSPPQHAWDNRALSADERADLVQAEMTLDEKIQLVHGIGWGALRPGEPIPAADNWGAGFIPGIERLGIPGINQQDSAVGVRLSAMMGRYSTLLPSTLAAAASWDVQGAQIYGDVIGRELRAQGFNMSIGGGVDLTREPRNGRNFEYTGEDPLLAGSMAGNLMKGVQARHIMGDIKHYAFNDQETGRNLYSALIGPRAARESDLLAFQIAVEIAQPAGIMCSYNRVNGDYACENDWLLNRVLKQDFHFKGWVLSDWGGTHSTVKAALAGLDQEMPGDQYFGVALKRAVASGEVPLSRLDDMDHRILRSMFAAGVIDYPVMPRDVLDPFRGRDDAQHIAEESIVLLKNQGAVLPLHPDSLHSILVVGSHADVGVLTGGGSAQVDVPGGNAANPHPGGANWEETVYYPASPLESIRAHAPKAKVTFSPGTDSAAAAALARSADVAVVFVNQPMHEDLDRPSLRLPDDQDALVAAVAAANPHTIVVLETGGPVTMPWAEHVRGIVESWYPGVGGAPALANLLFGTVNFSAKLPVSFAKRDADLDHPEVIGMNVKPIPRQITMTREGQTVTRTVNQTPPFDADYNKAGAAVGYKWFQAQHIQPLFPFGYGLSYTTYRYSGLSIEHSGRSATLTVRNTGRRAGTEIVELYARLPAAADEHYMRLVAFNRVALAPGESKTVTLDLNALCLSVFDPARNTMTQIPGRYEILAGASSADLPLVADFQKQ